MNPEPLLRAFTALRSALYSCGFIFLWAWLAVTVRPFDTRIPWSTPEWLRPLGFVLAGLGGLLALSCIVVFTFRGRGTPAPFDAPRVFVATGPYRFVRNPMYLGAAGVLAGAGLAVRSPAILFLTLGFLLLMHGFATLYEEPTLRARFGDSYAQYTRTVRRWIPGIPRGGKKRGRPASTRETPPSWPPP
ncbi:MAG TPA: methyltransferase [Thermoanaerobaculia bacterium]|nr:methyltransferase [Thermoanaerobaculia bacterium]